MRSRIQPTLSRVAALAAAALQILTLAGPAFAGISTWTNAAGGASNVGGNWAAPGAPGPLDFATFGPNAGYNVSWVSPVDTLGGLNLNAGRPRFYMTTLGVAGQTIINGDSLTLASGVFRTGHFLLGTGAPGKLLITQSGPLGGGGAQLISADSVFGSFMADGGSARASIQSGGRLYCNAYLDMAFLHTDVCSTLVAGGSLLTGFSGLATMSALGGGKRGDVIVADTGTAVLQIGNGGFVNVVGDLFLAAHGGTGKVHEFIGGTRGPQLTVHGQTYVGANADGPGKTHGTGTLLVERGSATLSGMTRVRQGSITIRNGALLAAGGDTLYSGPLNNPTKLSLLGAGTSGSLSDSVAIGTGAAFGYNAIVTVDSGATLSVTGAAPFNIAPDGHLYLYNGTGMTSTTDIRSNGECLVQGGTLQTAQLHLLNRAGLLDGYGTVVARVSIADSAALYCDTFGGPAARFTVGDSTADGFNSTGATTIGDDTLVVKSLGVAELGNVDMGTQVFHYSEMAATHGGHIAAGKTLTAHGTTATFIGPLVNDGTLTVQEPASFLVTTSFTQLGGQSLKGASNSGFFGGGLAIGQGATITARGKLEPALNLWGSLDLGPTPAKLVTGFAGSATGFDMQTTASVRFRIGRKSSGVQDTLVDNNFVHLDGRLDLRSLQGNLPAAGDTLTILTSPLIYNQFATVTMDGQPIDSSVVMLYNPNSVQVWFKKAAVGVGPGGPAAPRPLRFAGAGTLRNPEFALWLPQASTVVIRVYDVSGREVGRLQDGALAEGPHSFALPARAASSGVYFARAEVRAGTGAARTLTAHVVRLR